MAGVGAVGRIGRIGKPAIKRAGSGGGSPSLLPLYSTYQVYGDGVISEGAAPGVRNGPTWFLYKMKGRVRPIASWMQAKSGGDLNTIYDRRGPATECIVDIAHFGTQGHNPASVGTEGNGTDDCAVLNYDPAVSAAAMNRWKRNLDAFLAKHNGRAKLIIIDTTIPSNVVGELTTRAAAWAEQKAYIATKTPTGSTVAIILHATDTYWNPSNMSPSSDASRVHPDERGGLAYGNALYTLVSPYVTAETKDNILADTATKAWRGANLHPDRLLSGTTGTKTTAASGTTPTGEYATGQTITNRLASSAAVACSKDAKTGYDEQLAVITGTPAARETVVMGDSGNVSFTGRGPGTHFLFMEGIDIDNGAGAAAPGLIQFGSAFGSIGTMGSTGDPTTGVTSTVQEAVDTIIMAPGVGQGADTILANAGVTFRMENVANPGRLRISRPAIYQIGLEELGVMYYTGDDTIVANPGNRTARLTGTGVSGFTISAATVGTVRADPGTWENGFANWASASPFTVVLKKNGVVVSGAFSSGWTYNMAGQVTNGDTITLEVYATTGFGQSQTKTVTYTVGA